ncbi:MAG: DHH family phosphoesterase, partial [Clostridia bacterium]|nr:DHH family phosphoesterase [Clostridia bacterium]
MGLKQTTTIKQVAELLKKSACVALFAHTNPDGDTLGASTALKFALEKIGKTVEIFCDTQIDNRLNKFEGFNLIHNQFFGKYDLYVSIDCGDIFRLGNFSGLYNGFSETLTIDHHGGEYFSKYNCLCNYASTCQIIYELIKEMSIDIDVDIATYLYLGLCTDTGNFTHVNIGSDCFLMAADLVSYGVNIERIYRLNFQNWTCAETKFRAKILSRMRTYYDNRLTLIYITKNDFDEFNLDLSATVGLVNSVMTDTAKIGVCICEYARDTYKV